MHVNAANYLIYWLMIGINLLLLLGNLYKKPGLYWPFMISMVG
jgi:hypothetical protein